MSNGNELAVAGRQQTGIAAIGQGSTVLGQLQPRIPIGGRVRAGIMVLTSTASKNSNAVQMYDQLRREGMSYKEMNYRIKEGCRLQANPLTPKNVPFFTVRQSDFKTPGAAESILQRYGEIIPEHSPERQLYRFPVILPIDNWQGVMPHAFNCYSASERQYWSQYDDAGTRFCMMHAAPEFVGTGDKRQMVRREGGRATVVRPANDGRCVPDQCPEYQKSACKLTGRFIFYVPGIPGSSAIELPTTSFYALQAARQQLEMMMHLRGRISGTHNGKAMFWISKKHDEVSMLDPKTGKPKRVRQWIIQLEADIDMTRMFERNEPMNAMAAASEAAAMLSVDRDEITGATISEDDIVGEFDDAIEGELVDDAPAAAAKTAQDEPAGDAAEYHSLVNKIAAAADIDAVNEVLDLLRSNEALDDQQKRDLKQLAARRVKEVAK